MSFRKYEKKCAICGRTFITTVPRAYMCGETCRRKKEEQDRKERRRIKEQGKQQAPAGMIKTSQTICKKCTYGVNFGDGACVCDYMGKTRSRRNCPVGYCDKYKDRRRKR